MTTLPSFRELPVRAGAPPHSSWGVWGDGDGDRLGCWSTIDAAATLRGVASVRTGRVFSLNAAHDDALTLHMGRTPMRRTVRPIMGIAWDDVLDDFNTQGSTQWDGFGHFGSRVHGHYGGLGRDEHGVDRWAARGFATRGVLADIARWRNEAGRPLDVAGGEMVPIDEVEAVLDAEGMTVEPGDILLLRFGWLSWWRTGVASEGGAW